MSVDAEYGPWNPGLESQIPMTLQPLATLQRPEHVLTPAAVALEAHQLTGLPVPELRVMRPARLLLHELLIRVTADLSVPDGARIEDLGINFRAMASRLLGLLERHQPAAEAAWLDLRGELLRSTAQLLQEISGPSVATAGSRRPRWRLGRVPRKGAAPPAVRGPDFDPERIARCGRLAQESPDPVRRAAAAALARVLGALFATHGQPWGGEDFIVRLATDLAINDHGSEVLGRLMEPELRAAAAECGFGRLPPQAVPVVINTKGPSASGKSSLRPLQRALAGRIRARWSDFALVSPDIWRKQLLDYATLGAAYKYAGAFTAEELAIVDRKLDRYMELRHRRGEIPHLLIDRFRFDSFAPDSSEAGSNLLTRFGSRVYLFFVVTAPEQLVERAWKRGLEVGRYKAVDDVLHHGVQAYTGMADVFFTWVRRTDKTLRFEFLDNSVPLGARPRTIAFGTNGELNILRVGGLLDIVRFGRVDVGAREPARLFPDRRLLAPECNLAFLERCLREFAVVNFAAPDSGRIFLRLRAGAGVEADSRALRAAQARDAALAAAVAALLRHAGAPPREAVLGEVAAGEGWGGSTLGNWNSLESSG